MNSDYTKEDYSRLVERIKEVFADVPYPGDNNIISTPEHIAICGECSGLHKALVGRSWEDLIEDKSSSGYVSHAMSFCSPVGWHYYLPAYLIQSIESEQFSSLEFRRRENSELNELLEKRISLLDSDQRRTLVAYMLVVLKEDRATVFAYERNKETVEYWKEIYQKSLS